MTLEEVWQRGTRPSDRRPIHEWAREQVELPAVLTKRGHFDASSSRHFIEPLAALKDDRIREVNVMAPVRSGKSLIADIAGIWAVPHEHASVLRIFADDWQAKEHAEIRLWPMLRACPDFAPLLQVSRHRLRTQELILANGLPFFIQGPALGGLQAKGWKWVTLDEPWQYKPGTIGEAKARMGDFVRTQNNKLLCISQGGEEGSDWDLQFSSGRLHEWNVACMSCGQLFAPTWRATRDDGSRWGMVFEAIRDPAGGPGYDIERALASMRVECPHCRHPHLDTETTRGAWNTSGRFIAEGEASRFSRVSFHWNALIDYPWAELVREWLEARSAAHVGNFIPTVQFFQKRLAWHKSTSTAHEGHQAFTRIAIELEDPKEKLWPEEAARLFTLDRQAEDIYWGTIRAWARGTGESRRVWWGKLFGPAEIEAVREKYGVQRNRVLIDSGYKPKGDQGVYADCIRFGWIALKGADEPYFWHVEKTGPNKGKRVQKLYAPLSWGEPEQGALRNRKAPLIRFAAAAAAEKVHELIDRRQWIEPADRDDDLEREYRAQMAAEFKRRRTNTFTGRVDWVWVCPSGNNHAFDCAKEQIAGAWLLGLL